MDLDELVAQMRISQISLFYGAGVSVDCGGPNWSELIDAIKNKFPSHDSNDFFQLMQSIIGYNDENRREVETIVNNRLSSISPKNRHKYLFSIPWKAVMTTNYDRLPDIIGESIDGNRQIIPVTNTKNEVNQEKDEHLYCFKLLGDCQYTYPQEGWMVLSTSDLFSESERRANFFKKFRTLAMSGHIIYLGYSFKDDLVFLLLSHMKKVLQNYPWKGYAIMHSQPSDEIIKKLDSVGITWVNGTVEEFVNAAQKVYGEKPNSAPVDTGTFAIHGQTIGTRSFSSRQYEE